MQMAIHTYMETRTEGNGVHLALDDNRRVLASKEVHCLAELSVLDHQWRLVLLIFLSVRWSTSIRQDVSNVYTYNHPLVSLEGELGWLLAHQCLRFARLDGLLWRCECHQHSSIPSSTRSSPGAGEDDVAGTVPLARRAGFLCVISLLSTLRRPFVTSSPRLSCSKTAEMPPPDAAGAAAAGGGGGGGGPGGGGGGGGGGPPAAGAGLDEALNSSTATPYAVASRT